MTKVSSIPPSAPPVSGRSDAIVAVSNLHKTYRLGRVNVPVLRGISLNVRRGEWLAIRGASGSGKSTLLHLIGGLDRPDLKAGGSISFQGNPLSAMSQGQLDKFRASNVGFVFQFYHLLPELTVLQNVTIASMVRDKLRHARGEATARATELLTAFGLGQRLRHRPTELSGGERQRVAIARALINQPDILLADEPTGNLDRATGDKILEALQSVRRSRNQTIVMVTHDAEVAARADRIIQLQDGKVAAA